MANTSSDRQVDVPWNVIQLPASERAENFVLPMDGGIFPLAVWLARKQEIISRHKRFGLWLDSSDTLEPIADDLHYFHVIAIGFSSAVDQRGYATARLLRERYQFEGQVRAIGHVLPDGIAYLRNCGFDSFLPEADSTIDTLLNSRVIYPCFGRSKTGQMPTRHQAPAPIINLKGYLRARIALTDGVLSPG